MNKELSEAIKVFATKPHKNLSELLLSKSKDQLIVIFTDLLTAYINDRNSSTLREFITVFLFGYTHHDTKIGYNGFKQSTAIGGEPMACEAKPQNINTEDNKKRKNPRKLNGGGNFTDYTYKRFNKDLKENLNILVSGFIDGELIYIMEFPFNCKSFFKNLKKQLKKRFPKAKKAGEFLRSANFTFKDYQNCRELKLIYLNKEALNRTKINFTNNFSNFLNSIR